MKKQERKKEKEGNHPFVVDLASIDLQALWAVSLSEL